jgi:hypothetical protein
VVYVPPVTTVALLPLRHQLSAPLVSSAPRVSKFRLTVPSVLTTRKPAGKSPASALSAMLATTAPFWVCQPSTRLIMRAMLVSSAMVALTDPSQLIRLQVIFAQLVPTVMPLVSITVLLVTLVSSRALTVQVRVLLVRRAITVSVVTLVQ